MLMEETVERADLVGWALAQLKPQERLVLWLIYWHEWTGEEIGRLLGRSATTVSMVHHRALDRLRELAPDLELA